MLLEELTEERTEELTEELTDVEKEGLVAVLFSAQRGPVNSSGQRHSISLFNDELQIPPLRQESVSQVINPLILVAFSTTI